MKFDLERLVADIEPYEAIIERAEKRSEENPNAFHNWFYAVEEAGVPAPKTVSIKLPMTTQMAIADGDLGEGTEARESLMDVARQVQAAGDILGWPMFIKNSLFSGKHNWEDACFLSEDAKGDLETIARHISNITHDGMVVGAGDSRDIIVREFIDSEPVFEAFNFMPVTQEFRLFTDPDGLVESYQAYWPLKVFKPEHAYHHAPLPDDWADKALSLRFIPDDELAMLAARAEKVVAGIDNGFDRRDYSIDFLKGKDGEWYLIDMAIAPMSYRCDETNKPITLEDGEIVHGEVKRVKPALK